MDTWKESRSNVISQFVSFTDSATLRAINKMWKLWRGESFKPYRKSEGVRMPLFELGYIKGVKAWLQEVGLGKYVTKEAHDKMFNICSRYISEGSVYAEECLDLACTNDRKVVNPTLYTSERMVLIHYTMHPFHLYVSTMALFSASQSSNSLEWGLNLH